MRYFKSKLNYKRFHFIQETHSSIKNKNTWANDFSCPLFFSYGASNSWDVLTFYLGKKSLALNRQKADKPGRILILDVTKDADQYILINLYNANTEIEQAKSLEELQSLLK